MVASGSRHRRRPSLQAAAAWLQRRRGCSGGELLVSLAELMAAGGDHLVPGRVLHSGRRVVLRLAKGMLWAATFIAAYQRLRLLTSSA